MRQNILHLLDEQGRKVVKKLEEQEQEWKLAKGPFAFSWCSRAQKVVQNPVAQQWQVRCQPCLVWCGASVQVYW